MRPWLSTAALIALALCLTWGDALAAAPQEIYSQANALYAQDDYAGALRLYEQILSDGYEAPQLYYNAANCDLRMGKLGLALLMYRRAERLAPADDDIKANLIFVRSLAEGGTAKPEGSRLLRALLWPHRSLSIDGAAKTASICAFVFAAFLCMRVLYPRRLRLWGYCSVLSALVLAGSLASLGAKLHVERAASEAVVVAQQADVRSGPGEEFVVQASLVEGAEVKVKRTGETWIEISLGPDFAGWVKTADVEII
jgi:tetratricopeptide (TPR) repeat protein